LERRDGAISFELEKRAQSARVGYPNRQRHGVQRRQGDPRFEERIPTGFPSTTCRTCLAGRQFDIVMFRAVYYYLREPDQSPRGSGRRVAEARWRNTASRSECPALFRRTWKATPSTRKRSPFSGQVGYPAHASVLSQATYQPGENWFIPNVACVQGLDAGCRLRNRVARASGRDSSVNGQRLIATCTRTDAGLSPEHTVTGDRLAQVVRSGNVRGQRTGRPRPRRQLGASPVDDVRLPNVTLRTPVSVIVAAFS
jgi:hypothetical protein